MSISYHLKDLLCHSLSSLQIYQQRTTDVAPSRTQRSVSCRYQCFAFAVLHEQNRAIQLRFTENKSEPRCSDCWIRLDVSFLKDSSELYNLNLFSCSDEVPFYIVKNSWGSNFGNSGYLKIAIGRNICGIAQKVSAIVV